jgi:hypothetical protein
MRAIARQNKAPVLLSARENVVFPPRRFTAKKIFSFGAKIMNCSHSVYGSVTLFLYNQAT